MLLVATGRAPATDALLERFSLSLLGELQQYNNLPIGSPLLMGAISALVVAVASAPVLLAIILAALDRSDAPAAADLGAIAGHYYLPLLRLFVGGRAAGVLAAWLTGSLVVAVFRPVRDSQWELGRLASRPIALAAALVALALFWAATDYAMIHAIRAGSVRMFAAWRTACERRSPARSQRSGSGWPGRSCSWSLPCCFSRCSAPSTQGPRPPSCSP